MALQGFKAKNHRLRRDALGRLTSDPDAKAWAEPNDAVDDRRTPDAIWQPLNDEHGFTIDVAANAENAKCARFYDRAADGLSHRWAGEVVWCNPPYSDLVAWVRKALDEVRYGHCRKVVMLLPANRTEQRWWQDLIEPVRDREGTGVTTRNLPGRARFGTPTGEGRVGKTSAPFGLVIVVIEPPTRAAESESKGGGDQHG